MMLSWNWDNNNVGNGQHDGMTYVLYTVCDSRVRWFHAEMENQCVADVLLAEANIGHRAVA